MNASRILDTQSASNFVIALRSLALGFSLFCLLILRYKLQQIFPTDRYYSFKYMRSTVAIVTNKGHKAH